jgi:hypothetical protein
MSCRATVWAFGTMCRVRCRRHWRRLRSTAALFRELFRGRRRPTLQDPLGEALAGGAHPEARPADYVGQALDIDRTGAALGQGRVSLFIRASLSLPRERTRRGRRARSAAHRHEWLSRLAERGRQRRRDLYENGVLLGAFSAGTEPTLPSGRQSTDLIIGFCRRGASHGIDR